MKYSRTAPCNDCPYRMDAPLQKWDIAEFKKLLAEERSVSVFGCSIYGCHKNDGHVCVGWLMNQDKRNFPSVSLRLSLMHNNVKRDYLDKLHCKSEMFESVEGMIEENYPELLNN